MRKKVHSKVYTGCVQYYYFDKYSNVKHTCGYTHIYYKKYDYHQFLEDYS